MVVLQCGAANALVSDFFCSLCLLNKITELFFSSSNKMILLNIKHVEWSAYHINYMGHQKTDYMYERIFLKIK